MTPQVIAAITLLAAWLALVWHTVRKAHRLQPALSANKTDVVIIYASQTGTAQDIAQRTADALGPGRATLLAMNQINPGQLPAYKTALFIVSTYGEGDPPDMAQAFYSQMLAPTTSMPDLGGLNVAVLALGDKSYQHYCGFGRALGLWLKQQDARFLFDDIAVNQCDPAALLAWQAKIDKYFGVQIDTAKAYANWRLLQRRHTNPGSIGAPCYELVLQAFDTRDARWSAGDIAEIRIGRHAQQREYSIASTPGEGVLRLLIRQHKRANNLPGLGSHWLTQELNIGDTIQLHIRSNPLFHAPATPLPAIFIGNGTGIAGLRGLLQTRVEQGRHENWLIFGERQLACDFHYGEQLRAWHAQQKIQRLDLAFSRDQQQKHYVYHVLRDAAPALKQWVARGALIYVCGSKNTMARDVDLALREALGLESYTRLAANQRYRRDVY